MVSLRYYFGQYGEDEFEYDIDINNYFQQNCTPEELIDIAKWLYDEKLTDEDKAEYESEWGINSSEDLAKIDNYDVVSEILSNAEDRDILEYCEDDIKAYYESDAEEAYEDAKAYAKDPYGYNGVSRSDFF